MDNEDEEKARLTEMLSKIREGELDAMICASPMPELDPMAFYGALGNVIETITHETDLPPSAVAFNMLANFAGRFGKLGEIPLLFRNRTVKFYGVVIGGVEVGHKSASRDFVGRVFEAVDALLPQSGFLGDSPGLQALSIHGQMVPGEHIIKDLRDTRTADKRVLYNLDDFSQFFALADRRGSSLLPTVKNAAAGHALEAVTNGKRVRVKEPHICILGNATPGGFLLGLMRNDATLDTLAHFMFAYSSANNRSQRIEPYTQPFFDNFAYHIIARVAGLVGKAIVKHDDKPLHILALTPEAYAIWPALESSIISQQHPGYIAEILCRHTRRNVLNMAGLLALFNGENLIRKECLLAAMAWADYARETITRMAWAPEEIQETRKRERIQTRILMEVGRRADQNTPLVPWPDVSRAVRSALKCDAMTFAKAVNGLQDAQPPRLHVVEVSSPRGPDARFFAIPDASERQFVPMPE